MRGCSTGIVALVCALGCGNEDHAPPAPAPTPAPAPAVTPSMVEAPTSAPAAPTLPPGATPIDLLQAVPTTVTVSSVYQDRESLIPLLTDGDLATAWNSRSGDLVGAFIEVTVPIGAIVTGIEMTVGFTREGGRTDLFSGNHRVAAVRVLRDGTQLVEHALDPQSRALQTIPITANGGVFRIEIARVLAGSRTDWREICVSELRVLGVPDTETAPGITPTGAVFGTEAATAAAETSEADARRLEELEDGVEIFALEWADEEHARAPAERLAAEEARIQALFDTASPTVQGRFRCPWAGARMSVRVARMTAKLESIRDELSEASSGAWAEAGERDTAESDDLLDQSNLAERTIDALDRMQDASDDDLSLARRILRATVPDLATARDDWNALRSSAEAVTEACTR